MTDARVVELILVLITVQLACIATLLGGLRKKLP